MSMAIDRGMISFDYTSMLGSGSSSMAMYNAHMAVPNAGPYSTHGHCCICDGKPYVTGTSAAYSVSPVVEADLLGLFDEKPQETISSSSLIMADLIDIFSDAMPKASVPASSTVDTTSVSEISKKIASMQSEMEKTGWMSGPWKAAKKEAEDAFLGVQQLSVYYPTTPERENNRRVLLAAQEAKSGIAQARLVQMEKASQDAHSTILLLEKQLKEAEIKEGIRPKDPVSSAAGPCLVSRPTTVLPLDKISAMAVRQMIPQYEAEAVVAYLYPKDGYNKNTPLALQVINRIARENRITRRDVEEMLRE